MEVELAEWEWTFREVGEKQTLTETKESEGLNKERIFSWANAIETLSQMKAEKWLLDLTTQKWP